MHNKQNFHKIELMHFEVCGITAFHALSLILIATTVTTDELIFIQIVWRHGDRAPIFTYPTDTHQEEAWPYGWGELTQLGMMQQFALGRLIRQRYIEEDYNFLSQNYKPKELYIRSTDVNRTLISAMANLAGMYPTGISGKDYPECKQWPSHWTPIPIHTIDNEEDFVGNVFSRCPRADQLTAIIRCSKHYRDVADENKEFFDYVSKKSGMKVNLANVHTINDIHYAETMHNLSQPSWITDDVSKKLRNLSMITNEFIYGISEPYLPELIKLRGGSLLKLFLENINQKKECLSDPENPSCSWILQRKYFALSAVLFHEAFHHQYSAITRFTKGCPSDSDFCPLNLFLKRSKNFLPKNIKQECLSKDEMNRSIYKLCDTEKSKRFPYSQSMITYH
uniref:Histidine acid phosphatase n=1 Tax=Wuchereria bancrofti TaxID=6293 RepID=A0A1I8ER07_WUCBA